jgi:hypothetical protein
MCSPRSALFNVTKAVSFTTEPRGRPVLTAGTKALPGMAAGAVCDVTFDWPSSASATQSCSRDLGRPLHRWVRYAQRTQVGQEAEVSRSRR